MTARINQLAVLALTIVALTTTSMAASYTWTGGGSAGVWSDTANWSGGTTFPGDNSNIGDDTAIIPDGFGPSLTNVPNQVFAFTTGDTAVSLNAGLSIGGANNATITVGSGGVTMGGTLAFPNASGKIVANGNLTAPTTSFGNGGHSITQTAGVFNIDSFSIRVFPVVAWDFATAKPVTFTGTYNGTTTFAETPVFSAGHRPDWNMSAGGVDVRWDLNGKSLIADDIRLMGHPSLARHSYLYNSIAGGVIDANRISVEAQDTLSYLDLSDTTVTINGTGAVWETNSTRNTLFDITNNTTVTFMSSCSVDPGSKDRGGDGLQLTDFDDNFAFGDLRVAAGATVTITGDANIEGGGNTALYVQGDLQLDNGSTLDLNTRNLYLDGQLTVGNSPGTGAITNGGVVLSGNAGLVVEINGLAAGTEYDQWVADGDVSLSGALTPQFGAFAAAAEDTVFILSNTSVTGVTSGTFQYADDELVGIFNSKKWVITYDADLATLALDGGNDVALYAIPEPTTLGLVAMALSAMLVRRPRG